MQKSFSWPEKFCFGVFDHMVCLEGGQIGGQNDQKCTFFSKKFKKIWKNTQKSKIYPRLTFLQFQPKMTPNLRVKSFWTPNFRTFQKKVFSKKSTLSSNEGLWIVVLWNFFIFALWRHHVTSYPRKVPKMRFGDFRRKTNFFKSDFWPVFGYFSKKYSASHF